MVEKYQLTVSLLLSSCLSPLRVSSQPCYDCSPLTGLFFRTLTFLEHDIKPVYVIDGRPPEEKKAVVGLPEPFNFLSLIDQTNQ